MYPHVGQQWLEADYGSLEVRIIACVSQDPALVDYILNPKTDMHFDQAVNIFMTGDPDEEMTKELRFYAKNGFVFPQFYGSYYKPCASNLWKNCKDLKLGNNKKVINHLKEQGVRDFDDFAEHVRECESVFWDNFQYVKEWQEGLIKDYQRIGFIQLEFGFQRNGPLSVNQIINSNIQGSAFHLLLWSMTQIHKEMKLNKMKSKCMYEIHDSIGISTDPDELGDVVKLVHQFMVEETGKKFQWLIVPMDVEMELAGVDESWNEAKEFDHKPLLLGGGNVRKRRVGSRTNQ